jgi:hypothetical protein
VQELLRVLAPGGALVLTMPQGGLFGWLDGENLVNQIFDAAKRLRLPKPGGGRFLERFSWRRHKHYNLAKVRALVGAEGEIVRVHRGGLLLYPGLYLIEKCLESFCGRDLVSRDYRLLRRLRAWDFTVPFGAVAFNIAVLVRKREA